CRVFSTNSLSVTPVESSPAMSSLLVEQEVYNGAASNVNLPLLTQVAENLLAGTACFLQGVGQHGEPSIVQRSARQMPLLVGRLRQPLHHAAAQGQAGGVEWRKRAERVAEDVTEQVADGGFLLLGIVPRVKVGEVGGGLGGSSCRLPHRLHRGAWRHPVRVE